MHRGCSPFDGTVLYVGLGQHLEQHVGRHDPLDRGGRRDVLRIHADDPHPDRGGPLGDVRSDHPPRSPPRSSL
jgi:hypothetical protein